MRRRLAWLLGTIALTVFVACGDPYLHTNPYDPQTPVEIDIAGPDSLFSYGELGQYGARTIPAFPDTAVQWAVDTVTIFKPGTGDTIVDGANFLKSAGFGTFQSIAPPLEPATVTIAVEALIGSIDTIVARWLPCCGNQLFHIKQPRHIGFKRVVVTQRVARIQLGCPGTHACDTLSAGAAWSVSVSGFDALGHTIYSLKPSVTANPATPLAAFAVRDTTVATVSPVGLSAATVAARRSGTSWLVATRNSLLDSLQLVVR